VYVAVALLFNGHHKHLIHFLFLNVFLLFVIMERGRNRNKFTLQLICEIASHSVLFLWRSSGLYSGRF